MTAGSDRGDWHKEWTHSCSARWEAEDRRLLPYICPKCGESSPNYRPEIVRYVPPKPDPWWKFWQAWNPWVREVKE
jgi:hypothetical protein